MRDRSHDRTVERSAANANKRGNPSGNDALFSSEGQIKRLGSPPHPACGDRAPSPARVSQKREYFKYSPETIGDFALRLCKSGD